MHTTFNDEENGKRGLDAMKTQQQNAARMR
jgi:hypothetical protein